MLLVQREILQVDRKGLLNATIVKVTGIWLDNVHSLSDQGMLHDPGILASQAHTIIPHNVAFLTKDLDTYNSDCDDLSTAQAVPMDNISNYGFEVISELNRLTKDFRKHFTPQQELSAEQAFLLRISSPTTESSTTPPVKVDVPSELPKRSESYEKCLNLNAEFSKSKQAYDDLLKNYSQLKKHCISLELSIQLNQ
nr:hypothetical protein [Tanacetum cinerariifolium]